MVKQRIKIKVKVGNRYEWEHFCYVPSSIKKMHDEYINSSECKDTKTLVEKWATEDFGKTKLETIEDLEKLKENIKQKFKKEYPELYLPTKTDRQGWLRVWYTTHMGSMMYDKETKKDGR
jgi:hypothetical protein